MNETLEQQVAERTELAESRAVQLRALTAELTLAEQRERKRIAAVLHDPIQQLLVGARLTREVLIENIDPAWKSEAGRVLDLLNRAVKDMRSLSGMLSPPVLDTGDLSASLDWLAGWMRDNQGFEVELRCEKPVSLDQKDMAVLLFQCVRELLLNALKHSGVNAASVTMERRHNDLRIVVADRGAGFDAERIWTEECSEGRSGLLSIRERLELLGGSCWWTSTRSFGRVWREC